jgi:hypothetical protein
MAGGAAGAAGAAAAAAAAAGAAVVLRVPLRVVVVVVVVVVGVVVVVVVMVMVAVGYRPHRNSALQAQVWGGGAGSSEVLLCNTQCSARGEAYHMVLLRLVRAAH